MVSCKNSILNSQIEEVFNEQEQEFLKNEFIKLSKKKDFKTFSLFFNFINRKINADFYSIKTTDEVLEVDKKLIARFQCIKKISELIPNWQDWLKELTPSMSHSELSHLFQYLSILPFDKSFVHTVEMGLRTNSLEVFQSISFENPWLVNYLDTLTWNNMIIKSLFMNSALSPIIGIEQRVNDGLYVALNKFLTEKTIAKRLVPSGFWYVYAYHIKNQNQDIVAEYMDQNTNEINTIIVSSLKTMSVSVDWSPRIKKYMERVPETSLNWKEIELLY